METWENETVANEMKNRRTGNDCNEAMTDFLSVLLKPMSETKKIFTASIVLGSDAVNGDWFFQPE